jgi:hypothetical protein
VSRYAQSTAVSEDASMAEIRRMVKRYGATSFSIVEDGCLSGVLFKTSNRMVKITMKMPDLADERFSRTPTGKPRRSTEAIVAAWDQEMRRMWRALALVIKAKLEAVESGITTFDEEFLAHIVMPNGMTVGEANIKQLQTALESNTMPALLTRNEAAQ